MKDWKFLYNKYVHNARKMSGYLWDYTFRLEGQLPDHHEEFLNDIILTKHKVFIDIGANVGAWTIRASPYYDLIHAFEPNPNAFQSLNRNLQLNHIRNVKTYKVAIDIVNGLTEQAIIHSGDPKYQMFKTHVDTKTLDSLNIIPKDTIIKIDAEGSALGVIEGSIKSIKDSNPILIVEIHTKEESTIPSILDGYNWSKEYRPAPLSGDWLYREEEKQVFLIGVHR